MRQSSVHRPLLCSALHTGLTGHLIDTHLLGVGQPLGDHSLEVKIARDEIEALLHQHESIPSVVAANATETL